MPTKVNTELARLRAKEQLYDELVERLTVTERKLAKHAAGSGSDGVDPAWRQIANDLATALRPYALFREQRVRDGRIVVETAVRGATLTRAREALDRLGRQVAVESYRADGIPVSETGPTSWPRDQLPAVP